MSSLTASFIELPVNSMCVSRTSMPLVPSKTCTMALLPLTSSTWPPRREPSGSVSDTISLYEGNLTLSSTTSGLHGGPVSVSQAVACCDAHPLIAETVR
jgi:hypothetical protein